MVGRCAPRRVIEIFEFQAGPALAEIETLPRQATGLSSQDIRSGQHVVKEPTEPDGTRRYMCDTPEAS
jgi:hypothetical protein